MQTLFFRYQLTILLMFGLSSSALAQEDGWTLKLNSMSDLLDLLDDSNPSPLSFSENPEEVAKRVHQNLLDFLDPEKAVFLKSDTDELASLQNDFVEGLSSGMPVSYINYFQVYEKRLRQVMVLIEKYTDPQFNLEVVNDELLVARSEYATRKEERAEYWRKTIKLMAIRHTIKTGELDFVSIRDAKASYRKRHLKFVVSRLRLTTKNKKNIFLLASQSIYV